MRKIMFRAWLKEKNKMVTVNDLTFNTLESEPIGINDCGHDDCTTCIDWYDWKEVELMQYTGLKDKKGVEIYEGDIITVYELDDDKENSYTAPVVWKDMGWVVIVNERLDMPLFTLDDSYDWIGSAAEVEVVGNIYKDLELLNKNQGYNRDNKQIKDITDIK